MRSSRCQTRRCHPKRTLTGPALALAWALGLFIAPSSGCSGPSGPEALFELPRDGHTPSGYYGLPFPNDLRRRDDGTIDLDQHIRPNELLELFIDAAAAKSTGFGASSAIFVRFDGAIETESLPQTPRGRGRSAPCAGRCRMLGLPIRM